MPIDAVHSSGQKLFGIAELTIDNDAPVAEAMMEVEGFETRFAAASGLASDYILWSNTEVAVETLFSHRKTLRILKSAIFPSATRGRRERHRDHSPIIKEGGFAT